MSTQPSPDTSRDGPAWRRRKNDRPAEIVAAAREMLEAKGLSGVSMARIAARANVSEALVYRYFDSKQALINQVLTEWAEPFITSLLARLEGATTVRERLALIATSYLRGMDDTPRLHRVFYQELRWQDYAGSPLHRLNRRFANTVVDVLREGMEAGELRGDIDAAMVRDMLFGGLEHVAMRTSLAGKSVDVEQQAGTFVDTLLGGLRAG